MSEHPGLEAARAFVQAFNAQDHAALAQTLNYPHTRLAHNRFRTVPDAETFAAMSEKAEPYLHEEGWHHTILETSEVVHEGGDKTHLALTMARCRVDGEVYNRFQTFWIATCEDGHWGIRFRSSFLV